MAQDGERRRSAVEQDRLAVLDEGRGKFSDPRLGLVLNAHPLGEGDLHRRQRVVPKGAAMRPLEATDRRQLVQIATHRVHRDTEVRGDLGDPDLAPLGHVGRQFVLAEPR